MAYATPYPQFDPSKDLKAVINDDFTLVFDHQSFNHWLISLGLSDREKMLSFAAKLVWKKYSDVEKVSIADEYKPNEFGIIFFLLRVALESGAEYMQGTRNLLRGYTS